MDLFEARAKRRLTQWDLRKLTGIHQSKLSLIERGYIAPSDMEKEVIAGALRFGVEEIAWGPVNPTEKEKEPFDGRKWS